MKLFKLIRYDIKNGFWQSKWRLFSIGLIVLISCIDFYIRKSNSFIFEEIVPKGTFGDYICYLLGGIPEYHPGTDEEFVVPVKWFLFHMLLLYGTLHYSVRDLYSLGIVMLPRCGQRRSWWLAKCLWNVFYILAAYALAFGIVLVFCVITGEQCTLTVTGEFVSSIMGVNTPYTEFPVSFSVMLLTIPCLFSIGNSLLLLVLTLFIKPILSYGVMLIFFLCGAYFHTPFLWESMTMGFRSEWVTPGGYTMATALTAAGMVLTVALVIGFLKFQKYDILNLESE